ncbi:MULTISPECIES: hypothetical protein [unclassified Microcoleus]|uniref:hypothetical protein n=1 Tax=unclassified Microcoleus TaxID=2642155 RepID=UPI002FCFFB1A
MNLSLGMGQTGHRASGILPAREVEGWASGIGHGALQIPNHHIHQLFPILQ